jgi:hypothetical protein
MASEVDQLFQSYRSQIAAPWQDGLSGMERVWFLVYRPETERRVVFRLEDFQTATIDAGHGWVRIDVADRYARWLGRQPNRARYFASPAAVPQQRFATDLIDELAPEVAAAGPNDVVALTGTISLFGVAKLSEVIKGTGTKRGLDAHVRGRLLVLFPGSREQNTYRFLEAGDGWNYMAVPITATSKGL